jgi:uncharacterized protein (TIGR02996 family)
MSDEAALLHAITAHPDDDTPRLVYADWLDEHDQPERAEFIRVECEAERTDRSSPAHLPLLQRASDLFERYRYRWFKPLVGGDLVDLVLTSRGFVDTVVLSPDDFADHADTITTSAPLLRELHINTGGDWRAFFAEPLLSRIRALTFADEVFELDAAEELEASDYVSQLIELELNNQPLGYAGIAAVASARLSALQKLAVSAATIDDDGAEALFAGKAFGNLRELDMSENLLTGEACHALAAATGFGRLERLSLCENHITGDGIAALADAPHLRTLRILNLYANPIGPEGGRAILASRNWGNLNELHVAGCGCGIEVVNDLRWVYGEKVVKV